MITRETVEQKLSIAICRDFECARLGVASDEEVGGILSYLADKKFLGQISNNRSIRAVFVTAELSSLLPEEVVGIVVDDPIWCFFSLVNSFSEEIEFPPSSIGENCNIHKSAVISEKGVVIGNNVMIEPNVVIHPGVTIDDGVLIRSGAVLGVDGYEHKRTSKGILSVKHDGEVFVHARAEVGVNTFVAKGFSYRPTIIGVETKVDALVHYAHGVQSGERCYIVAHAMLGGNLTMGNDVWIGPSASIANRLVIGDGAFVTMGSVVTRNVAAGEKVTGNFAIPHHKFLANLKKGLSND